MAKETSRLRAKRTPNREKEGEKGKTARRGENGTKREDKKERENFKRLRENS